MGRLIHRGERRRRGEVIYPGPDTGYPAPDAGSATGSAAGTTSDTTGTLPGTAPEPFPGGDPDAMRGVAPGPSAGPAPAAVEPGRRLPRRAAMDTTTARTIESGSTFELFAGALGVALAIVGIAGVRPIALAGAAVVAIGFALIAQGSTMAARWQALAHPLESERGDAVGIGTEVFGGFAAIVLGVLALIGVAPTILLPVGAIVLGGSLLFGGPVQPDLAVDLPAAPRRRWQLTRADARSTGGVMVMAGLAALVLGILAIAGQRGPVVLLSLIGVACVGGALVLVGGLITARLTQRFAR